MTDKEAQFLLGASRPNGEDSAEFAEALAQATHDPELKAWHEDQRQFDLLISSKVQAIQPPADLRSRLLTGGRVSEPVRRPGRWVAIVAMLVIFCGLGAWYAMEGRGANATWENKTLATLSQLAAGEQKFDAQSNDVTVLQHWLKTQGVPCPDALPTCLCEFTSIGCKMVPWNGHSISIICFHGPNGELVHLAMMDRAALSEPPPEGHPAYDTNQGWQVAQWSQDGMAMMLVTRGTEPQLRTMLGIVMPF